jgi:hypothetical protein
VGVLLNQYLPILSSGEDYMKSTSFTTAGLVAWLDGKSFVSPELQDRYILSRERDWLSAEDYHYVLTVTGTGDKWNSPTTIDIPLEVGEHLNQYWKHKERYGESIPVGAWGVKKIIETLKTKYDWDKLLEDARVEYAEKERKLRVTETANFISDAYAKLELGKRTAKLAKLDIDTDADVILHTLEVLFKRIK